MRLKIISREVRFREIGLVPTKYDAVAFGYAPCGSGIVGLTARSIPVVAPRAHDRITLFMGSHQRYADYFLDKCGQRPADRVTGV
jgi:hypothetical protein